MPVILAHARIALDNGSLFLCRSDLRTDLGPESVMSIPFPQSLSRLERLPATSLWVDVEDTCIVIIVNVIDLCRHCRTTHPCNMLMIGCS